MNDIRGRAPGLPGLIPPASKRYQQYEHHEYPPMLGALEDVPPGTSEWAERLGLRIRHSVDRVEEQGVERLIPWIEMALDADPPPWRIWPAERPCLTPDGYFKYAACISCASLVKLACDLLERLEPET